MCFIEITNYIRSCDITVYSVRTKDRYH